MEITEIMRVLPHRFPMLLVDRVLEVEPGKKAVGIKNVTVDEWFFAGHYPERPIMPGVLIVEAMAQVAGFAMLDMAEHKGKLPYFTGIDKVKFRRPVVPGDQLRIEATVAKVRGSMGRTEVKAFVDGQVASEGLLSFVLVDANG